jgi:hypothetical protein
MFGTFRMCCPPQYSTNLQLEEFKMAKPGRKVKKANHGARPACSRPRKQRRHRVKT